MVTSISVLLTWDELIEKTENMNYTIDWTESLQLANAGQNKLKTW